MCCFNASPKRRGFQNLHRTLCCWHSISVIFTPGSYLKSSLFRPSINVCFWWCRCQPGPDIFINLDAVLHQKTTILTSGTSTQRHVLKWPSLPRCWLEIDSHLADGVSCSTCFASWHSHQNDVRKQKLFCKARLLTRPLAYLLLKPQQQGLDASASDATKIWGFSASPLISKRSPAANYSPMQCSVSALNTSPYIWQLGNYLYINVCVCVFVCKKTKS